MLLVDDDQAELVEFDLLLHQRVRADDEVGGAAFDVRQQRVLVQTGICCRSADPAEAATRPAAARCCCGAGREDLVGAMNATWRPFSIATIAASSATIVLPAPTSPWSRRCIGGGRSMSSTISLSAPFCPG